MRTEALISDRVDQAQRIPAKSLGHPYLDFWLLGGLSIVVWLAMGLGQVFRSYSEVIDQHYYQIPATFGLLALICNDPHFLISYKFGYGRGKKFVFRHWFSLIAIPLILIGGYVLAFFQFKASPVGLNALGTLNAVYRNHGMQELATPASFGNQILSSLTALMYLTVGWHYAKQVFGCMMVYANFDGYLISKSQRTLIKASLFAVAGYNFIYMMMRGADLYVPGPGAILANPFGAFTLPNLIYGAALLILAVTFVSVVYAVIFKNYRQTRRLPHINLIMPWIAFYIWWIPVIKQQEYYLIIVPFFHSLQYLPFAYRLESSSLKLDKTYYRQVTLRIVGLIAACFVIFELIPQLMDDAFLTRWNQIPFFFAGALLVFINIHHFFIDSVVWKFTQPEVRDGILLSR